MRRFTQLTRSDEIPFTLSAGLLDEIRIVDDQDHELMIKWRALGGAAVARIEIPDDSWSVLVSMNDVLVALADLEGSDATPEDISVRLREMGLEDVSGLDVEHHAPGL